MHLIKNKKLKGFTLIELLVALFVFGIIMAAASQTFASALRGYRHAGNLQKDVENAQFSLNLMAKELRTSSVVSPTTGPFPNNSSHVQFFDHSQDTCFRYRISGGALQVASISGTTLSACESQSFGTFTTLSTGTVSGVFRVTPSDDSPIRVGKVTVTLDISEGGTHHAVVQTSASLRDYGTIDL